MSKESWSSKTIADISHTFAGGTPPRQFPSMFGGGIPWVKSSELNRSVILQTEETLSLRGLESSSAKWVPANTPLIAMYGATAGVISWLQIRATTNQAVLAILPSDTNQVDSRWLYWSLTFHSGVLLGSVQGSGQPNLSKGIIDDLSLPLPSIAEQRRIAEVLDTVDAAIQATETLIAKLKQMKAGLLHDLLTRGLDAEGNLRDPIAHPEQFKETVVGRVPREWEVLELKDLSVGKLSNGFFKKPELVGFGFYLVNVLDPD